MDLTPHDEAALVSRIREGDRTAFDELCAAYAAPVYGFIRGRSDNDDHAQDIAQETWRKLWETRIRTFDSARGGLLPYLKGAAWKALAEFYRALHPVPRTEPDLELQDIDSELPRIFQSSTISGLPPGIIENLILCLTVEGTSPPHQLISFVFAQRLGWEPREIVAKLSEVPLRSLEEKLENDYIATSALSPEVVRARFKRLRDTMVRLLNDVLKEPKTRKACEAFLDRIVGDTLLTQYYTRDPAENIASWCNAVIKRARAELVRRTQRVAEKST